MFPQQKVACYVEVPQLLMRADSIVFTKAQEDTQGSSQRADAGKGKNWASLAVPIEST